MKIIAKSLEDTKKIARAFASAVYKTGAFVTLSGDIGVGKTTFTRHLLQKIGVTQNVTSPTFVILNEYHGDHIPVYHFDLYRLEKEGIKSILCELDEYIKPEVLTLVEWAEFGLDFLPFESININIAYGDDILTDRIFEIEAKGEGMENIFNNFCNSYLEMDKCKS